MVPHDGGSYCPTNAPRGMTTAGRGLVSGRVTVSLFEALVAHVEHQQALQHLLETAGSRRSRLPFLPDADHSNVTAAIGAARAPHRVGSRRNRARSSLP